MCRLHNALSKATTKRVADNDHKDRDDDKERNSQDRHLAVCRVFVEKIAIGTRGRGLTGLTSARTFLAYGHTARTVGVATASSTVCGILTGRERNALVAADGCVAHGTVWADLTSGGIQNIRKFAARAFLASGLLGYSRVHAVAAGDASAALDSRRASATHMAR